MSPPTSPSSCATAAGSTSPPAPTRAPSTRPRSDWRASSGRDSPARSRKERSPVRETPECLRGLGDGRCATSSTSDTRAMRAVALFVVLLEGWSSPYPREPRVACRGGARRAAAAQRGRDRGRAEVRADPQGHPRHVEPHAGTRTASSGTAGRPRSRAPPVRRTASASPTWGRRSRPASTSRSAQGRTPRRRPLAATAPSGTACRPGGRSRTAWRPRAAVAPPACGTSPGWPRRRTPDPRGWRNAGVAFKRVRGASDFSLVLAEASWLPRFSSTCSVQ